MSGFQFSKKDLTDFSIVMGLSISIKSTILSLSSDIHSTIRNCVGLGKGMSIPLYQGCSSADIFSKCRNEEAPWPESGLHGVLMGSLMWPNSGIPASSSPWADQLANMPTPHPSRFHLLPSLPPPTTFPAPVEFGWRTRSSRSALSGQCYK